MSESSKYSQVAGGFACDRLRNSNHFVSYSMPYRQPVQFAVGAVYRTYSSVTYVLFGDRPYTDNTSKIILYSLKFCTVSFTDTIQYRVTVIESAGEW